MKIKIKPFIRHLILANIFYILGSIFALILIFIVIKIGLNQALEFKKKIDVLKKENNQLMNKITLLNSTVPESIILDEDVKFLNTLIPNSEDYFSIIYTLEKLSQKSGFIITDYTVNVGQSTPEKLRISATGTGDSQSFVDFLKDYNFSGGRLITSDKVQLDPNFSGSIIVDLTFYNKKTELSNQLDIAPNVNIYQELEGLKSRVNFSFLNTTQEVVINTDYPKKSNPF